MTRDLGDVIIYIMKRSLAILAVLLAVFPAYCQGSLPPKSPDASIGKFVIDNFESGDFKKGRDWWTFDRATTKFIAGNNSRYALELKGDAHDWYVGGVGTYLAQKGQDLSRYDLFEMDVYGTGPDSGSLKIEMYQGTKGKGVLYENPKKGYDPKYVDRFVYNMKVDWKGWKHISAPIMEFVNDNPEARDTVWNPKPVNGSGGLLQIQIVAAAGSRSGRIAMALDNVELKESEHKRK